MAWKGFNPPTPPTLTTVNVTFSSAQRTHNMAELPLTYVTERESHLVSKSPGDMEKVGWRRMQGGELNTGASGISSWKRNREILTHTHAYTCTHTHTPSKHLVHKRELHFSSPTNITIDYTVSIGNRMDESAIWEKIARQQKNCTRRSRVLFELL